MKSVKNYSYSKRNSFNGTLFNGIVFSLFKINSFRNVFFLIFTCPQRLNYSRYLKIKKYQILSRYIWIEFSLKYKNIENRVGILRSGSWILSKNSVTIINIDVTPFISIFKYLQTFLLCVELFRNHKINKYMHICELSPSANHVFFCFEFQL